MLADARQVLYRTSTGSEPQAVPPRPSRTTAWTTPSAASAGAVQVTSRSSGSAPKRVTREISPVDANHDSLTDVNYKRNLDIVQQDRDGTTLRRWSLSRAWPVKFVAGDWDNEADENVIESVTLTFDFFELVQ